MKNEVQVWEAMHLPIPQQQLTNMSVWQGGHKQLYPISGGCWPTLQTQLSQHRDHGRWGGKVSVPNTASRAPCQHLHPLVTMVADRFYKILLTVSTWGVTSERDLMVSTKPSPCPMWGTCVILSCCRGQLGSLELSTRNENPARDAAGKPQLAYKNHWQHFTFNSFLLSL